VSSSYEIGVDIGGTFTDVVCRDPTGALRYVKIPTTRGDPGVGVARAVAHMKQAWGIDPGAVARFVHGTTIATNAVLERKGATVGLITTEGFRDVLEIGRQNRSGLYDVILTPQTPVFLAPGRRRLEVPERIAADGSIVTPLDEPALHAAVAQLVADGVEAIAVCFLFSFINPVHEERALALIEAAHPGLMVSLSSRVDPAFREYERTCVTCFDAYVKPVLDTYLAGMERDLARAGVRAPLQIMQSRGGISAAAIARRRPVRLFLSGPAAGVIGGQLVGQSAGHDDLITVDIGGTSCDVALIPQGIPMVRAEGVIDGYPVRVPMVDVNTIGAGGGSIAWLDAAQGLRVGPRSAGADPGPACYGRGGTEPTVTDASIVLGYIDPDFFAGGSLTLQPALARRAIETAIAGPMGLTVEAAALGIHRVVNAQMAEAIRLVSINRGYDPRQFSLVALGGGGPVHATALAADLSLPRVIVPQFPGVLSAFGLLSAPIEHERATAFPRPLADTALADVAAVLVRLDDECRALMGAEGVDPAQVRRSHYADVCYIGQSYFLEVPLALDDAAPLARLYRDFLVQHERVYGHAGQQPAKLVNLRAVHRAGGGAALAAAALRGDPAHPKATRKILVAGMPDQLDAAVYDRAALAQGARFDGPAIVEQSDTTTIVEPGWRAEVGPGGALILTPKEM
jgi:N-methylhydantoinase A